MNLITKRPLASLGMKLITGTLTFAFLTNTATAAWTDKSNTLPGFTSGTKIALVAGIGCAIGVAAVIYHRHHKASPMPVDFPPQVTFGPSATESTVSFRATGVGVNLSELRIKGKGFSIGDGGPKLPLLLKPDDTPLDFKVIRTSTASRGALDVTFLDSKGKAYSGVIALSARGK